jgi:hypothetical protein
VAVNSKRRRVVVGKTVFTWGDIGLKIWLKYSNPAVILLHANVAFNGLVFRS